MRTEKEEKEKAKYHFHYWQNLAEKPFGEDFRGFNMYLLSIDAMIPFNIAEKVWQEHLTPLGRRIKMTAEEKFSAILRMKSIGQFTDGTYPTFSEFKLALSRGRVCGNYDKWIVIVANHCLCQFAFILEEGTT